MLLRLHLSFKRPEEKKSVSSHRESSLLSHGHTKWNIFFTETPLTHIPRSICCKVLLSCYYHNHKDLIVKILSFLNARIVCGCALIYALHLPCEECFTESFAHPDIHPFNSTHSESKRFLALVRDSSINTMHENTPRVPWAYMRDAIYTKLLAFHIFIYF